jgi:hypothetical protein
MTDHAYVYVLFRETNTGSAASESDGYVVGVYATEEGAAAALVEARQEMGEDHSEVVWDDETEPEDWTVDWRIETHQVLP